MKFFSKYSRRVERIQSSEIREILKVTQSGDIISFAGGLPSPRHFPVEELAAAFDEARRRMGASLFQYSISEGLLELREYIAARQSAQFGRGVSPEEVMITTGSQQALDFMGRLFLEEGSPVYVEKPTFAGALQAFRLWNPSFYGVETTPRGPNMEHLIGGVRRRGEGLFYIIPNFQNPSGVTHSRETREAIADVSQRHNLLLLEDDPYGELYYEGEKLPPVSAFHEEAIYLGSFSKSVAPGLRLGWVTAPREVIRKLAMIKQAADLHSSVVSQAILVEYLRAGHFEAHAEKLRRVYRNSRDKMAEELGALFPEAKFQKPAGGMFLWLQLPPGIEGESFQRAALKKGVAVVTGSAFDCDGGSRDRLRLNFSNASDEDIERGVALLRETYLEAA